MLTPQIVTDAVRTAGLADVAIVIQRLDRPDTGISLEPDRKLYPASMIKTPLALAVLALVQDGALSLDRSYEVTPSNMTENDKPSPLVPGYRSPAHELIDLMLTRSDNVATNMLLDAAGRERATAIVRDRFGLAQTAFYRKLSGSLPLIHDPQWDGVHRNTHPASDAGRLFRAIARDEVPFAQYLRAVLLRQQWNNKLSAGLYPGDTFAHKTGDTDEVTHDGGILDTEQGASYVVVVYTGMESTDANNAKFAPFMSQLRGAM